ncbi:MAG: LITAF-like zinc ribbon domain-containing protein [Fimbriimonadaceae bacterium]
MADFTFTDEDRMFPVYCVTCKAHVPRAMSNANSGMCPTCQATQVQLQATQQAQAAAQAQANQAALAAQQAHAQSVFAVRTGIGACPKCNSQNLTPFAKQHQDNSKVMTGCLLGMCCLWPLLFIAPLLGKQVTQRYLHCNYCGNEWFVG